MPFEKWLSGLRKRNATRRIEESFNSGKESQSDIISLRTPAHPTLPSATSSFGALVEVDSISLSTSILGSSSLTAQQPRRLPPCQSEPEYDNRTVRLPSCFSAGPFASVAEDASRRRAIQRTRLIEELVTSEENYLQDLKTLSNVKSPLCANHTLC